VARPGGARRQLTFFEAPIAQAERRPSGTDIAYLMDRGGSEFFQIFLMDPTTTTGD
jgi:Tol biopolymer transport system component